MWFKDLSLNVIKTKEMIVDYRKRRTKHAPVLIDRAVVEQVECFKFLGVHITNKLTWSKYIKTELKFLYFLVRLHTNSIQYYKILVFTLK